MVWPEIIMANSWAIFINSFDQFLWHFDESPELHFMLRLVPSYLQHRLSQHPWRWLDSTVFRSQIICPFRFWKNRSLGTVANFNRFWFGVTLEIRNSELRFGSRWAEDALYNLRRPATRSPCVQSAGVVRCGCWRFWALGEQRSWSWPKVKLGQIQEDRHYMPLRRDLRNLAIDTLEQCPISSPYNIYWTGSETQMSWSWRTRL